MKNLLKTALIPLLCTLGFSAVPQKSVWREATTVFGSNADRYLYLALPLRVKGDGAVFPLVTDEGRYYVKEAKYSVTVDDGTGKKSFDVEFAVRKSVLNVRGVVDNLVVDIAREDVYDIVYILKDDRKRVEYHNYFRKLPDDTAVRLFPGFYGSKRFGVYENGRGKGAGEYVGFKIVDAKREYIKIDPSPFTDLKAEPFESGERSLARRASALDYAAGEWDLISELKIWNIFHYGIDRPKERRLTGFLKIEFYVKPLPEPMRFGNVELPFSNVWYGVDYRLSAEEAKAAIIASDRSLVPKRSHFVFKKRSENENIDLDIEIDIENIEFERAAE